MSNAVRIVVRYLDGQVRKGTTQDFSPNRDRFHLQPLEGGGAIEVRTTNLKAVFFVKTFEGDSQRQKQRGFVDGPPETTQGKKIAVRFTDGELVCGYTLSYTPGRGGFFVTPADAAGNTIRVYVLTEAATEIKAGAAAENLALSVMDAGR